MRASEGLPLTSMKHDVSIPLRIGHGEFMVHISEEVAEQYAMRTLPAAGLEQLEEHLLICCECRQRLVEIEQHVGASRAPRQ